MIDAERLCGTPVPQALCGTLRPQPCGLMVGSTGAHSNDHKSHLTVPHVGKVVFRWKLSAYVRTEQPPVVDLPILTNSYLTGQMRHEVACECPDWWVAQGQKMHHSPCRKL